MARIALLIALFGLLVLAALGASPAAAISVADCDRVAAPGGSDSASGTVLSPYATATQLVARLTPGETGCLREGTYIEDVAIRNADVALAGWPGERATLRGRLYVPEGADRVTVSGLYLDGRSASGLPSPTINADDVTFAGNDVTNYNTGICFILGNLGWGNEPIARRTLLTGNRIHDCGRKPATNFDHGIYVAHTVGARIIGNVIYDNADRGIQLYPSAQDSVISGNVIDGNGQGVIFSGSGPNTSSGNVVENNIISNPQIRSAVESWYPAGTPVGTGNVVRRNCIFGRRTIDASAGGFSASDNLIADPLFTDRTAKDFSLLPTSPCAGLLAGGTLPDVPASSLPVAAPTASPPSVAPPSAGPPANPAGTPSVEIISVTATATPTSPTTVQVAGIVSTTPTPPAVLVNAGSGWRKVKVRWSRDEARFAGKVKRGARKHKLRVRIAAGEAKKTVSVRIRTPRKPR